MTKYDRNVIVKQAQSWLGCKESNGSHRKIVDVYNSHTPRARGYKLTYADAWCSGFASACAIAVGYTAIIPTEVGCERHIELFKNMGCWVEDDAYVPAPGDYIFYDWDDNANGTGDCTGWADHVGIVESVNGSKMTIIEGNYSNSVARTNLLVNGRYIRGYGVPKYDKTTTSSAPVSVGANPIAGAVVSSNLDQYTDVQLACMVWAGTFGNGATRKQKLGNRYNAVQGLAERYVGQSKTSNATVEALAREVIAGKWGNGGERKTRLTNAGFNYTAVQNKVNQLL